MDNQIIDSDKLPITTTSSLPWADEDDFSTVVWKKRSGGGEAWDFDIAPEFIGRYVGVKDMGKNMSKMYLFTKNGKDVAVWGSTVIDSCLGTATPGSIWRIIYHGMATTQKGGEYKNFEIFEG